MKRINNPRPSTRFVSKLDLRNLKVVEVGVFEARNADNIMKKLDVAEMVLIDPYEEYVDYHELNEECGFDLYKIKAEARKRMNKYGFKVKWIYEFSDQASQKLEDDYYDFIYIDGNHQYEYAKKDIELYYPKLKEGGILAGDNIDNDGVIKALGEFALKNNLKIIMDYPDWIIFKK